ncbi:MAG: diguanylate cyclase [Acidimicrobiales bacterium]
MRIRSVLLLAVLLPVLGMAASGIAAGAAATEKRDVARQVQREVLALAGIVHTRVAVGEEISQSTVVAVAADLGVGIDRLTELYGTDYRAALASARAVVDTDPLLSSEPSLAGVQAQLLALRVDVDAESVTFDEVRAIGSQVNQALGNVVEERLLAIHGLLLRNDVAGTLHARNEALEAAVEMTTAGGLRTELAVRLIRDDPEPGLLEEMLDAASRQRTATEHLVSHAGSDLASVAQQLDDPAAVRFEVVLDEVAATYLVGETSPLAGDWSAFGTAFVDGDPWVARLQDLVLVAAGDLEGEARRYEQRASGTLRDQVGRTTLPAVLAVVVALLLARSVSRPARRLEASAHEVTQGHFFLEPIPTTGPRELSDVATAFNEMSVTLAAVEAQAMALAGDPDAERVAHRLPGQTGRALEAALDHLRASMRRTEQHRRELEHTATHDGLTGLLNRSAALTMIDRDLAQAARTGGSVMALFVDLDGFKAINDGHGHAAGDEALCLAARALRATTRGADVVARIGGDELLVTGMACGRAEVEVLAERIRSAIAACRIPTPAGSTSMRCSIGAALVDGHPTTVDALIGQADAALYEAKRQGGDRVMWSSPHEPAHTPVVATAV